MSDTKLNSCPFCGKREGYIDSEDTDNFVRCENCDARGPSAYGNCSHMGLEAAKLWNKRFYSVEEINSFRKDK